MTYNILQPGLSRLLQVVDRLGCPDEDLGLPVAHQLLEVVVLDQPSRCLLVLFVGALLGVVARPCLGEDQLVPWGGLGKRC